MLSIEKFLPFVKEQIEVQTKLAQKFEAQEWRNTLHTASKTKFQELYNSIQETAAYVQKIKEEGTKKVEIKSDQLNLSFDEIEGLPEELVNELSISEADKVEFTIQQLIDENGGVISLDRLLVALYKKTGDIYKRNAITSKLYRMSGKGMVFSVPNKKGVYSTSPVGNDEVEDLASLLLAD